MINFLSGESQDREHRLLIRMAVNSPNTLDKYGMIHWALLSMIELNFSQTKIDH